MVMVYPLCGLLTVFVDVVSPKTLDHCFIVSASAGFFFAISMCVRAVGGGAEEDLGR